MFDKILYEAKIQIISNLHRPVEFWKPDRSKNAKIDDINLLKSIIFAD